MSQPRTRTLSRRVATPAQIFRALMLGAVFALILVSALRETPVRAMPAGMPRISAAQ